MTTMQGVFISYRQSDSKAWAVLLREELGDLFGHERIFLDRDTLAAGSWREQIGQSLDQSRVVLVVIGAGWIDARGADQSRRLDDPDDVHRREVAQALAHAGTTVIPILVDGTPMPPKAALPPDLHELAERQARTLSSIKAHREVDLRLLAEDIQHATGMGFTEAAAAQAEPMHFLELKLDEAQARAAFGAWAGRLLMAPRDFAAKASLGPLSAAWVPCWLAEASVSVFWRGRRGKTRQAKEATVNDKGEPAQRSVEQIDWTDMQGDLRPPIEPIVVDAITIEQAEPPTLLDAKSVPQVRSAPVLPQAALAVKPTTVLRQAALDRATDRIVEQVREAVRKQIGGDKQELVEVNTHHDRLTLRTVWVPVYEGRYAYGGADTPLMINAHSGAVGAASPLSKAKIGVAVGIGLAVVAVIAALVYFFSRS